jgi:hypothetical protein
MKERKMKIRLFIALVILIAIPGIAGAEDFLGMPATPDATIINKTDKRFEFSTGLTHDEAVSFYREQLKLLKQDDDIKYREWKASTYIEDDGKKPWHAINISKEPKDSRTIIVITKDNWGWIISTLLLRFIGVFVVLAILYIGFQISGYIMKLTISRSPAKIA